MPGVNYTLDLKTGGFTSGVNQAIAGVGSLGGKLLSLVGIGSAVAAALAGVQKAVGGASSLESTTLAFETLLGSMEEARVLLEELRRLGAETPFEFPELADAGRKLVAFGEAAAEVPEVLRRIGDIASGVQAPISEIAELYGKARVQGTLFAEDINQLTGRGIPVIQEFARILGVSEREVKQLASEGKITFALLERAFANLTNQGGKFAGMMSKQSASTAGLWSTLKDSINEVFIALGQPINDALKPWLREMIGMTTSLGENLRLILRTFAAASSQGGFGELIGATLMVQLKEAGNFLMRLLGGFGTGLATLLVGLVDSLGQLPELLYAAGMNLLGGAQVLTKADFWNAVAVHLTSLGLRFAAGFGEGMLPVLDEIVGAVNRLLATLGKDPINTDGLRAALAVMETMAGVADRAAEQQVAKAVAGVRKFALPEIKGAGSIFEDAIKAAFAAFAGTDGPFDTSEEKAVLEKWARVQDAARRQEEEAQRTTKEQQSAAKDLAGGAAKLDEAAKLMARLFGVGEEKTRIRTFNRAESATRRFLRRSKADQDGSLKDFLGRTDSDLYNEVAKNLDIARIHAEANRAGEKATRKPSKGNQPERDRDSKATKRQEDLLSRIDENTRQMAEKLNQLQPA